MEPNNFEKNIQEQFNKRTLEPSAQAWDRLDAMLTVTEEKKPKKGFFWMNIAASFIVLLGIGFFLIQNKEVINTKQQIVLEQKSEQKSTEENAIENPVHATETHLNTNTFATHTPNLSSHKNNMNIDEELVSDKPQHIKNLTIYLSEENIAKNNTPNNEIITLNKRKYNYVSPESLLAEVENSKKTSVKKNTSKSTLTVDANELLLSAEAEINPSFKDKAFAKFKEVQTAYNNRNLE